MSDQIFLRDHIIDFEIGAFSEERGQGQRLAFSVFVDVPGGGRVDDDVDQILSYDTILDAIDAEIRDRRVDLLETLAEGIAQRILSQPLARRVRVRIEKLDRVSGRLGVEIIRVSDGEADVDFAPQGARPIVNCVAQGASAPVLEKGPQILLVEGDSAGTVNDDLVARRLDLLACEMAGWELASTLDGVDVVATRTELDYAIKMEKSVIWAPAKMVFGAGGGATSVPTGCAELAVWLGKQINASEVRFFGFEVPSKNGFQGRLVSGVSG